MLRRALFEALMKFNASRVFLPKFSNKKVLILSRFSESSIIYGFKGLEETKPKVKIVLEVTEVLKYHVAAFIPVVAFR